MGVLPRSELAALRFTASLTAKNAEAAGAPETSAGVRPAYGAAKSSLISARRPVATCSRALTVSRGCSASSLTVFCTAPFSASKARVVRQRQPRWLIGRC
eukprot:scaffold77844_cov60-Phaeocystis_antarctica.AAC.2